MIIDVEEWGRHLFRYESDVTPRVGEVIRIMGGIEGVGARLLKVSAVEHLVSESAVFGIKQTQVNVRAFQFIEPNY